MNEQFAHIRDTRLLLRRHGAGAGPALLWAHGLLSSMALEDQRGWPAFDGPLAAAGVPVLRYDARGHGASAPCADGAAFDWPQLGLDMLAVADAAGHARFIAAGESMGAMTALCAAVQAPQRVAALILVSPPPLWEARRVHAAKLARAAGAMARRARHSAGAARLAPLYLGAARAQLPARALVAGAAAIPTLIVAWEGDAAHPVASALELQLLLPGAVLVHLPAQEGGAIDAAIAAFMTDAVLQSSRELKGVAPPSLSI